MLVLIHQRKTAEKCRKPLWTSLNTTITFGVTWALVLTKKVIFAENHLFVFWSLKWFHFLFCYLFVWYVFFVIKVVSMEVVQDFFNSPTLEKFKNIPSTQRRSLLAEYLKVCNMVFDSLLGTCFVCWSRDNLWSGALFVRCGQVKRIQCRLIQRASQSTFENLILVTFSIDCQKWVRL